MREIQEYMKKTARSSKVIIDDEEEGQQEQDDEVQEVEVDQDQRVSSKASSCHSSVPAPSSGTAAKRRQSALNFHPVAKAKVTNSVASMIRKTPEEVIEERH